VLYPGSAESETDLSLSTLLDYWGDWHSNIATWTSGTKTITFDATKSTIYNTLTVMGGWTTIDEGTLTPSLFSSIVAGDKIVVGKIAKASPNPAVKAGWCVKRLAIDGDDANEILVAKKGIGLQVILR
jgi:hypothetical protein